MGITRKVLLMLLSEDHLRCRNRLALALNRSQYSIRNYLLNDSAELTKAAALEIIREETGLSNDQILTKDNAA